MNTIDTTVSPRITSNFSKPTASARARETKNILVKSATEKTSQKFSFSVNKTKSPSLPSTPSPILTLTSSSQRLIEVPLELLDPVEPKKEVQQNSIFSLQQTDLLDSYDIFAFPSPTNSIESDDDTSSNLEGRSSTDYDSESKIDAFVSAYCSNQYRNSLTIPPPAYTVSRDESRAEELRKKVRAKGAQFAQRFDFIQRQLSDLGEALPSSTRSAPGKITLDQIPIKSIPKLSLPAIKSYCHEETKEGAAEIDYHSDAKSLCEIIKLEKQRSFQLETRDDRSVTF